jgi:hypothetical protein
MRRIVDYREFTFYKTHFLLILSHRPTPDGKIFNSFYAPSTLISGYDIYIDMEQSGNDIHRYLFHEIVEILLQTVEGESKGEAHLMASRAEEKYFGERDL